MRKIKVIGYPYAIGGRNQGCAMTPQKIAFKPWFKNLKGLEYEEVQIESHVGQHGSEDCERITLNNSLQVRKHTYNALKEGFFPIVFGGDNSLSLGTILAMKKFAPNTQTLWLDSHIDIKMKPVDSTAHMSSLQYLTGINCPTVQYKCLEPQTGDIVFIGHKQSKKHEHEALEYLESKGCLLIARNQCKYKSIDQIARTFLKGGK